MLNLMLQEKVKEVAMESTGVYWIPIWRILQVKVSWKLANPNYIKQLPGRKTDVKDAQWIVTGLQKGLVRGSYIPGKHIQELRQYERRYVHLCEQLTRIEQEIDRQLSRCNIRITSYTITIGSKSVMNVVKAIIDGESTADQLIRHVHDRIVNKNKQQVYSSLEGVISEVDKFIFSQCYQEHELVVKLQQECTEMFVHKEKTPTNCFVSV